MRKVLKIVNYQYWNHDFKRKNFKKIDTADIDYFSSFLPKHSVITDSEELQPHNLCFRKLDKGDSKLMLLPKTTADVSKILKYCNEKELAVVPQGGNTGLVGGSVPVFD